MGGGLMNLLTLASEDLRTNSHVDPA